jgi:hypothetical protein
MAKFYGKEATLAFEKAFGTSELTTEQLWCLTKFAKHVRLRARNNVAFNNYMGRVFPHAQFKQVPKEYNGRKYEGLQITAKGVTTSDSSDDDAA